MANDAKYRISLPPCCMQVALGTSSVVFGCILLNPVSPGSKTSGITCRCKTTRQNHPSPFICRALYIDHPPNGQHRHWGRIRAGRAEVLQYDASLRGAPLCCIRPASVTRKRQQVSHVVKTGRLGVVGEILHCPFLSVSDIAEQWAPILASLPPLSSLFGRFNAPNSSRFPSFCFLHCPLRFVMLHLCPLPPTMVRPLQTACMSNRAKPAYNYRHLHSRPPECQFAVLHPAPEARSLWCVVPGPTPRHAAPSQEPGLRRPRRILYVLLDAGARGPSALCPIQRRGLPRSAVALGARGCLRWQVHKGIER